MMVLMGAVVGCDGPLPFIEPISADGDSERWAIYAENNQAAGTGRLAVIEPIDRVRYSMGDRWTAFVLTGDLAAGTPPVGMQLPRLADRQDELTVDVGADTTWSSFRVYDRGECSLLLRWQSVADAVFYGLVDRIGSGDRAHGVELRWGELTPTLRSEFTPNRRLPPEDRDQLRLRWRMFAENLGTGRKIGCDDVSLTVDTTLEAVSTDLAWFEDSDDLMDRILDHCDDGAERAVGSAYQGEWTSFINEWCDVSATVSIDGVGDVELGHIADLRHRQLLSHSRGDETMLVGLRSIGGVAGQSLDAHDTLFEVLAFDISDVETSKCTRRRRRKTLESLNEVLPRGLVLALNAGLLEQAQVDPFIVGESGVRVRCESNEDCDFRSGQPPFQATDGSWGGARHVCKTRDKEALRDLARDALEDDPDTLELALSAIEGLQDGDFCHAQLEPDHLNVRPDGLEGVLAYSRDNDRQGHLLMSQFAEQGLCGSERAGVGPAADPIPQARFVETVVPLTVP